MAERKCPVCGKPREQEFRPFCSKRCADLDLGRWFNDSYRVPTDEPPDSAEILPFERNEDGE